jgi:uncharacterized membrane protein HdeD (DUF308 family)
MTLPERSPKLFDYFAGAILTNGLAMIAIYLAAWELIFQYLLIPLWFVAAGISAYLVCMRTSKNHLVTGAKTAVFSIILGFFMVPTLQSLDFGVLGLVLVCYLVGSIGGSYFALRKQLKMKSKAAMKPSTLEP